jgi:benzoylformate decarboxylase
MRRAFRTASTPPTGPVFVSLPWNVLDEEAELDLTPASPVYSRIRPDSQAVDRAAHILAGGENPLMLVGDRVAQAGAVQDAVKVAETLGARVMAAGYSEVNFPNGHPQFMGLQNTDSTAARGFFDQHDVILAVGCNLFTQFLYAPQLLTGKSKLVHLDVNVWEIERNYPAEVGLWGDIKAGLQDLDRALGAQMSGAGRKAAGERGSLLGEEKARSYEAYVSRAQKHWEQKPLNPIRLFLEMKEVLPQHTLMVSEAVTSTVALMRTLPLNEPGSYFSLRGGGLGWGMGGALGVKLARPDRPVVAVIGDGSAMYSMQALWTAVHYDLPVVYVICNNRSYRILKHFLVNYYLPKLKITDRKPEFTGMNFFDHPLDCAGVAAGFGVPSFNVEDPDTFRPTLEEALALGKPTLLDVHIHPGPV